MSSIPGPIHPLLTGSGEYPFVKLERRRRELQPAGVTTINFGPKLPPNPVRRLAGHSNEVTRILTTPDQKVLVTASLDHSIKLWDMESGEIERTLEGLRGSIKCLALTVDRPRLLSGSSDGVVLLSKLRNGQQLASFRYNEDAVFSP